jgi:DNA invertase Pin-like site-specific DNA recombinase
MTAAVAYFRISSVTNVGEDKDSQTRQRLAVEGYAARHGLEIVHEYCDAAVKSGDRVGLRPGFAEMIAYMSSNGAVPSWSRARRCSRAT